jgi:uncharacterized membrane protein
MFDLLVLGDWLEFAVRWVHVITAIAWIGSSFYFIALDLGLHRDRNLASGADGRSGRFTGVVFTMFRSIWSPPSRCPMIWSGSNGKAMRPG